MFASRINKNKFVLQFTINELFAKLIFFDFFFFMITYKNILSRAKNL